MLVSTEQEMSFQIGRNKKVKFIPDHISTIVKKQQWLELSLTRIADCSNEGLVVWAKEGEGGEGGAAQGGGGYDGVCSGRGHHCQEEEDIAKAVKKEHGDHWTQWNVRSTQG